MSTGFFKGARHSQTRSMPTHSVKRPKERVEFVTEAYSHTITPPRVEYQVLPGASAGEISTPLGLEGHSNGALTFTEGTNGIPNTTLVLGSVAR